METTKLSFPAGTAAGDGSAPALSRCPRFKFERLVMFSENVEFHTDDDDSAGEGHDDDGCGVVRVKVVLTKKQLRQILAMMGQGCGGGEAAGFDLRCHSSTAADKQSLQQCSHVLPAKRLAEWAAAEVGKRSSQIRWRPALSSIPEEISRLFTER